MGGRTRKVEREPWVLLTQLRTAKGMSQGAMDEAIGRSKGTTLQIEKGTMLPPDRATADAIDEALGREPGSLWADAAPARLRALDPDLYAWHREQIEEAAGFDLSEDEQDLIYLLRCFNAPEGEYGARLPDLADRLTDAIMTFRYAPGADPDVTGRHPVFADPRGAAVLDSILTGLRGLPVRVQHTLWALFLQQVQAWSARG